MEWKFGEIREVNGEWYQCVLAIDGCRECSFRTLDCCTCHSECMSFLRRDGKSVIFKKLEKVGKPFERNGYMYQEYKAHTYPLLMSGGAKIPTDNGFAVIIKQTKKGIEEKKIQLSQEDYDYIKKKLRIVILPGNLADGVDSVEIAEEIMKLFTSSKGKN